MQRPTTSLGTNVDGVVLQLWCVPRHTERGMTRPRTPTTWGSRLTRCRSVVARRALWNNWAMTRLGWSFAALYLAIVLQGCGSDADPVVVREPVSLRYDTFGCYGLCPSFSVTLARSGTGAYVGRDYVLVTGTRAFHLSAETFDRALRLVQPIKPDAGSIPRNLATCGATDGDSHSITWVAADGGEQTYCLGAHREAMNHNKAAERIAAFLGLVPIAEYVDLRRIGMLNRPRTQSSPRT